jgi:hypothetical protein
MKNLESYSEKLSKVANLSKLGEVWEHGMGRNRSIDALGNSNIPSKTGWGLLAEKLKREEDETIVTESDG